MKEIIGKMSQTFGDFKSVDNSHLVEWSGVCDNGSALAAGSMTFACGV